MPTGPMLLEKMVRLSQNAASVATIGCSEYSKRNKLKQDLKDF